MKLEGVELRKVRIPFRSPFRTSFGTQTTRVALILRAVGPESEGWGECVALEDPIYSSEYTDGCSEVLRRYLIPGLAAAGEVTAAQLGSVLAPTLGHRMAKAALEMAVLDAELKSRDVSLAEELGAVASTVPSGVSVGIMDSIDELLEAVTGYLDAGYVRVKLKIEPGWDIEPVRAVREKFGDGLLLQADANTAYTRADIAHLAQLDEFRLLLIEQPFDEDDILGHAQVAGALKTPICLDESIVSAQTAADAIALGACQIINIKPGRVGGLIEARRIHDVCVANQVPVWCGGMMETGIGRAANVALAALPGFTLPGDISASARYYELDITEPFELVDGHLPVPTGSGIGIAPLVDILDAVTVSREWVAMAD
jgi:o-succinylbenzoate synthase